MYPYRATEIEATVRGAGDGSPEEVENVISVERCCLGHVFSRSGLWFFRWVRFNPSFHMGQRKVWCTCDVKTDWLCVLFGWPRDWHRLDRRNCVPWLVCAAELATPHDRPIETNQRLVVTRTLRTKFSCRISVITYGALPLEQAVGGRSHDRGHWKQEDFDACDRAVLDGSEKIVTRLPWQSKRPAQLYAATCP